MGKTYHKTEDEPLMMAEPFAEYSVQQLSRSVEGCFSEGTRDGKYGIR